VKAGIGGGVAAALLLAGSVSLGIFFYTARKAGGVQAQLGRISKRLAYVTGVKTRGDAAGDDFPPGGHHEEMGELSEASPSGVPSSRAQTLAISSGTGVTSSTALDLLKDSHPLWDPLEDLGLPATPQHAPGSTETVTQTSGRASGSGNSNSRLLGSLSRSRGRSGKTDSARTFYSIFTSKKPGATPSALPTPFAGGGTGTPEIVPAALNRVGEQPDHEDLWTRGVDPADVEILKDANGKAVVLGRGSYAVVYHGRWQATSVAVKVMLASDSDVAQREMRSEADILRGMRHPNVVLLMAVCISPNGQVTCSPTQHGSGSCSTSQCRQYRSIAV
jgi:hypothetical protein